MHHKFKSTQLLRPSTIDKLMAELVSFILAVASGVDVVARTSFAVAQLIGEWKDAPAQIVSLSDEIKHFHDVTMKLKEFSSQLETCSRDDLYVAAISSLIHRAEPYWAQLQNIIQSLTGPTGHLRKQKWLRVAHKVSSLQEKLRGLRLATIEVLSIHTA